MGRFAVNISYNIGLQYAAELLPTVVRAQGVALIHIMGYVASILAPFVVYLVSKYMNKVNFFTIPTVNAKTFSFKMSPFHKQRKHY